MGKEGKDAERYNTWNVYVIEARAGAAPRNVTQVRRQHSSAVARPSRVESRRHAPGLPAKLRREAGRVQHEPHRGGPGGRRRAEDPRRRNWTAPSRAPRFTQRRQVDSVPGRRRPLGVSRHVSGQRRRGRAHVQRTRRDLHNRAERRMARSPCWPAGDTTHPEIHVVENGKLRALTHHNDALMARIETRRHRGVHAARPRTAPRSTASSPSRRTISRARSIPRCCAFTADRTGRTRTRSTSSGSSSRPTDTSW